MKTVDNIAWYSFIKSKLVYGDERYCPHCGVILDDQREFNSNTLPIGVVNVVNCSSIWKLMISIIQHSNDNVESVYNTARGNLFVPRSYDENDELISETYNGVNEEPLVRLIYDPEFGITKLYRYNYDDDGKLALSEDGYAILEMDYDESGKQIGEKFYNIDENPILNNY